MALSYHFLDNHLGEFLTVAVFAAIAFAAFFLEHNHFVALDERFLDGADYFGAFNGGSADLNVAIVVGEKNVVELYGVTVSYIVAEVVHIEVAVLFCLELLAFDFYNNVHCIS